jgi:deoxyhypusine monooxygenase
MSVTVSAEQMTVLRDTLLNTSGQTALHERFRALFMLKAVGTDEVVQIVSDGESSAHSISLVSMYRRCRLG